MPKSSTTSTERVSPSPFLTTKPGLSGSPGGSVLFVVLTDVSAVNCSVGRTARRVSVTGMLPTGSARRHGDGSVVHPNFTPFGFLSFGATGPLQGTYNDIAGAAWADWLFMLGLLGIGAALILGIAMRIAAAAGALLLVMMWSAVLPPENNPFMDDHLIYALVLGLLARPRRR